MSWASSRQTHRGGPAGGAAGQLEGPGRSVAPAQARTRPRPSASAGRCGSSGRTGTSYTVNENASTVLAVPCDMVVAGYGTEHVNVLRLWDARAPKPLDMQLFSRGEYLKATEEEAMAETITKILYPEDNHYEGKSLRLKQQYFFVSATVQSVVTQASGGVRDPAELPREERHPDQRHPPGPGDPGADAHLHRRGGHELGRGLAHHHELRGLHQPHRPGGGPGALAPAAGGEPAAASLADPAGDRPAAGRRRWRASSSDPAKTEKLAILWGGEVRMANLCVARRHGCQRRLRPALRDPRKRTFSRTPAPWSPGSSRMSPTASTTGAGWRRSIPRLDGLIRETCRRRRATCCHPEALPGPGEVRGRSGVPCSASARSSGRTRRASPRYCPEGPGGHPEPRRHLRRAGEAAPRV